MEVKEGEDKPYFCSGAVHIRRGANSQKLRKPADVRKIFDDAGKLNFDMGVCPWFKWEDVSEKPSATSSARPASHPRPPAKSSSPTSDYSPTRVK
jgi:hypothetical protein